MLTDDLASAGVHGGGLLLVLGFGAVLLRRARTPLARRAVEALLGAWILLYLSSISFHLLRYDALVGPITLALDDGTIFVAIAGTYTAVALLVLRPADQRIMLPVLWGGAAAGIALAVTAISAGYGRWYQPSAFLLCAGCGWGPGIAYCRSLARGVPRRTGLLILASGLVYVGGLYFYRDHALPWHHTYWHLAVVIGCLLDFTAVSQLLAATPAASGRAPDQNEFRKEGLAVAPGGRASLAPGSSLSREDDNELFHPFEIRFIGSHADGMEGPAHQ